MCRDDQPELAKSQERNLALAGSSGSAFDVRDRAVLWPAGAVAHDLEARKCFSRSQRDGSFVLDVANDPSWLKLRLERFSRQFRHRNRAGGGRHEVRPASVEFIPGDRATHRLAPPASCPTPARCRW